MQRDPSINRAPRSLARGKILRGALVVAALGGVVGVAALGANVCGGLISISDGGYAGSFSQRFSSLTYFILMLIILTVHSVHVWPLGARHEAGGGLHYAGPVPVRC